MFILKSTVERRLEALNARIDDLLEKYGRLWSKHELLLKHLELKEITMPVTTELKSTRLITTATAAQLGELK